ncbi:hypothetical protein KIH86_18170 [Paenibacillus sp. HN-1]|uniref:hypothetical protein n=1 Tax=Paenibacillus TaxID=44249 RepID=UPI001CAA29D2|nr:MULTISPECIES: hypothetical protein [Paenibacillus]MBY9078203.1 hypothetical protein [Paenibacillus sp. CGMCC 1.18879]MBY9086138.1 hypothetical protein [Paenibacillus sinensis]
MSQQLYSHAGKPCRNFNILATEVLFDPVDGREKLVLSNYAMGETGSLILIDTLTGQGENLQLPAGPGAWGLVNWHNDKLVVGTCVDQAYLHVLDLRTRQWAPVLESEGESYFWGMTLGSDGKVYGGTYPGCSLMQYDPQTHSLLNLGKVSENGSNQYSRPVWGEAAGYILMNYGFDTNGMKAYRINDGRFIEFGKPGEQIKWVTDHIVCTEHGNELAYYDAATLLPVDGGAVHEQDIPLLNLTLANGQTVPIRHLSGNRAAGVRGQEYFITELPADSSACAEPMEVELKRIPVEAPATAIFTLQSDGKELLWGASGFGQTVFSFNPSTGAFWNSPSVCNAGGEVYGMQFMDSRLFLSAYVGGDHVLYDPSRPWEQLNNLNPRTLRSVAPELIRPEGRSVCGPDGAFWTGWSAQYGVYGGGLSRVDPATLEVEHWYDPVPGQQVSGLAADEEYLYFTTNGGASGLPPQQVQSRFVVWEPGKGKMQEWQFEKDQVAGNAIAALGGRVACCAGEEIHIFDRSQREFVTSVRVGQSCQWLVALDEHTAGAFCGEEYWELDVKTGRGHWITRVPGYARAAALHDGKLYFAVSSDLYVLNRTSLEG